jgi:thymidylate synthase (FAD)
MKLINSSVEVWKQKGYDVENILKHIEKCGRVCYKSEDKITTDSYIKFTNMLKSAHHFSVF